MFLMWYINGGEEKLVFERPLVHFPPQLALQSEMVRAYVSPCLVFRFCAVVVNLFLTDRRGLCLFCDSFEDIVG